MANESKGPSVKPVESKKVESKSVAPAASKVAAPEPEKKVKFLVWFTAALQRFEGLKAHHLTAVRSYFQSLLLPDPGLSSSYDEGLKKYGLKKKK
jgi:hypothetical protein